MLTIKEAMQEIEVQFIELFGPDIKDVRLEGIEEMADHEYHFTVSFLRSNEGASEAIISILGNYIREYKDVVASKETGALVSAKVYA
ncbi:hypothetical protein FACS1894151_03200 [Spirochaetia bacterium]|nr:hypothetical protein FACS1894151_03200 [Spirochaetia bacterium]